MHGGVVILEVGDAAEARAAAAAGAEFVALDLRDGPGRWAGLARASLGGVMPIGDFGDAPYERIVAAAGALALTWVAVGPDADPALASRLAGRFSVVWRLTPAALKTEDTRSLARVVAAFWVTADPGAMDPFRRVHGPTISRRPIWIGGGLAGPELASVVARAVPAGVALDRDDTATPAGERVAAARAAFAALPPPTAP